MYDLSVSNEVEVHADNTGKARKTRRWVFKNHTKGALDLTGWRIWFDTQDLNAQVESAVDSQGKELAHWESTAPDGGLRVTCDFDGFIPHGESYWIQVDYDETEYFVGLLPSSCWIVNDWFARSEPLNADPYIVQDPQKYSLCLHIPDIRRALLFGFRDPTRSVEVEANQKWEMSRQGGGISLRHEMNLRSGDRSPSFYVLYHVVPRFWILGPIWWAVGIVIAAVSVELLRGLLWGN